MQMGPQSIEQIFEQCLRDRISPHQGVILASPFSHVSAGESELFVWFIRLTAPSEHELSMKLKISKFI